MFSDKVVASLAGSSQIRKMFEQGNQMRAQFGAENVFDFSIGNPDPEPPEETLQALRRIANSDEKGLHGYMSNAGYQFTREAVASELNSRGANVTFENVVMTVGAGGALNIIFKALLNPGDEVIAIAPYFMEYNTYAANYDAKIVPVMADKDTFQLDLAALEAAMTPRTKIVVINSPNNPTGVIYPAESLQALEQLLQKKGQEYGTTIFPVSDEPYRELVYDGAQVPQVLGIFKNAIVAYSYSKSLSLPGERIGYVAANSSIDQIDTLMAALIFANRALGFVNAPALMQRVIAESMGAKVDVGIYKERRDLLYNHLVSLGFECAKPQGAFYLFPKCPASDPAAFQAAALKRNIIIVLGGSFGTPAYFRLAYCTSKETIARSLPAFTALAGDVGLTPPGR